MGDARLVFVCLCVLGPVQHVLGERELAQLAAVLSGAG